MYTINVLKNHLLKKKNMDRKQERYLSVHSNPTFLCKYWKIRGRKSVVKRLIIGKGTCDATDSSPREYRGSAQNMRSRVIPSPTLAYFMVITEPWLLLIWQESGTKASNRFPSCTVVSGFFQKVYNSICSKMLCSTSRKWDNGWWRS